MNMNLVTMRICTELCVQVSFSAHWYVLSWRSETHLSYWAFCRFMVSGLVIVFRGDFLDLQLFPFCFASLLLYSVSYSDHFFNGQNQTIGALSEVHYLRMPTSCLDIMDGGWRCRKYHRGDIVWLSFTNICHFWRCWRRKDHCVYPLFLCMFMRARLISTSFVLVYHECYWV